MNLSCISIYLHHISTVQLHHISTVDQLDRALHQLLYESELYLVVTGFITSQLLTNKREYWIGLYQVQSGRFGWVDNAPVTYTNWARNEPNGGDHVSN